MPRKAIVFDLDGTLVDSLPDIIASFQRSFGAIGASPPPKGAVRALVGHRLEDMYARFVEADLVPVLAAEYRRRYPRHFTDRSRPFPGVLELLGELRRRGYLLAVATTKRSDMADRFVRALGLNAHLDVVQGTDEFPSKPAPDVIYRALEAVGGTGEWMVGDTVHDIEAGRAAGLKTFAVTWGTHGADRLAAAEPDVLADDVSELLGHVW